MAATARLADIYVKIHNKQSLTFEDLAFLSKFDRECFEKTCQNLLYKMPESKELMEPVSSTPKRETSRVASIPAPPPPGSQVDILLDNLKLMELHELPVQEISVDKVKDLLGNLYMEMLFPHNDRTRYFRIEEESEKKPRFNVKI